MPHCVIIFWANMPVLWNVTRTEEGQDLAEVLLGLKRDYVSAATIKTAWPLYIRFREGLMPIAPVGFTMIDKFVKALGMAFLNKGQSGTTTPITIPDINRPGL